MNPRTTGILFLVALALGAFVYFYEIGGEADREAAEVAAKRLFPDVEEEAVEKVEITTTDAREVTLSKVDGAWRITAPLDFPADDFAADAMATGAANLTSEAIYEDPQALEVYGLGEGATEVRFSAAGAAHVLRLGDKTPVGSNTYAQIGGGEDVYAVATQGTSAFHKSLEDLREKRILDFDTAAIEGVSVRWPDGSVVLEKTDGEWLITEPVGARADAETVEDLLSDLSYLRANGFVDDPPPDSETGLDAPAFAIELSGPALEEGGEPIAISLAVGANLDGAARLVRASEPVLYRIPAARLDDFPRDLIDYRFREVSRFGAAGAKRMEFVFRDENGEPVTLTATREEAGWTATPEDFRPGKLATLLAELANLKARAILADEVGAEELGELELDPPNAIVRVFGEDEKLAEVQVGTLQGGEGIIAKTPDRPAIYRLSYELSEHLPVSHEAFQNHFVAEPVPEPPAEEPPAEAESAAEGASAAESP